MAVSSSEADDSPGLSPSAAFALLANETRMAILQTLWESDEPLSFSALFDRVDFEDSGNFNYHLKQLVGHFVQETVEGYALRMAGEQVIRSVLAGAITKDPSFDPTELDAQCPYCGAPVEAWYSDEIFTVRCTHCEGAVSSDEHPRGTFLRYNIPPAGLQYRTPEEVLAAAHTLYDAKITAMMEKVCPECAAIVDFSFDICPDHEVRDGHVCTTCRTRHNVWVEAACENCRYTRQFIVWFAVMTNPAVVSFYHDHGVPWNRVPIAKLTWKNASYVAAISEEILSEDPLRIRITIPLDDDVLQVTVDNDLNVVDVT